MASGTEFSREDIQPSLAATRQAGMDFDASRDRDEEAKAERRLNLIHVAQTSVNVQPVQGLPSFQKNGTATLSLTTANVNLQEKQPEAAIAGSEVLKLVAYGFLAWLIYKLIR